MSTHLLQIKEYRNWILFLHKTQYYIGRLYLYAKREDAIDFIEMTSDEKEEFFVLGKKVKNALSAIFQPDLMNYASLGNINKHLHVHFIPRYKTSRYFDDIEFKDEQWGDNYIEYHHNFYIPDSTILKIKNIIIDLI